MPDDPTAEIARKHARKLFPKPLQISCLQRSKIVTAAADGQDAPMRKTIVLCENVGQYVDFVQAVMTGELMPFPPFELQALTAVLDMLDALKEPEEGDSDA